MLAIYPSKGERLGQTERTLRTRLTARLTGRTPPGEGSAIVDRGGTEEPPGVPHHSRHVPSQS
jgi:hypothetical protein